MMTPDDLFRAIRVLEASSTTDGAIVIITELGSQNDKLKSLVLALCDCLEARIVNEELIYEARRVAET